MNQIDLDLDLLRCFITVADLRSFTLAGDRMGRSQSAVSVRIRKLEDLLGTALFERNSRDVKLTNDGRRLLPKAWDILDKGEELVAAMREPVVSGRLRIGFLEYVSPHRIPEVLSSLRRKLPNAELSFHVGLSSTLITALDDGRIDVALALHDDERRDSMPIASDQLVWVEGESSPKAANPFGEGVKLCLMQAPCVYRTSAMEAAREKSLRFEEVLTANSVLAVHGAVASGLGLSVLGTSCIGKGVRAAEKRYNLPMLPNLTIGLYGTDPRKIQLLGALKEVLTHELSFAAC